MRYLSREDIIQTNRQLLFRTGGLLPIGDNLFNPGSLDYLLDVVQYSIGGQDLYPSVEEKAAAYAYNISTRHIFNDGNKRTGMACTILFLNINGYYLADGIPEEEIANIAIAVADDSLDLSGLIQWIKEHLERRY